MVMSNIRIPLKTGGDVGLILSIYACEIDTGNPKEFKISLSPEHEEYDWFNPADASDKLKYKYPKEFTDLIFERYQSQQPKT